MAGTRHVSSSFSLSISNNLKFSKPSNPSFLLLPRLAQFKTFKTQISCEIKSSDTHRNWTIENLSDAGDSSRNLSSLATSSAVSMASSNSAMQSTKGNAKKVYLFYCAETKTLAKRVAAESDAIELRNISWGKFPDGFPDIFIPNAQGVRGHHVAFLASFSSPGVIFEQIPVIYALPKVLFISSFTLVLPFFPTGTYKRMEDEGDVATAFTLARLLSNIPISRGGPTSLVTFDIHALQERFYFGDNILPCFEKWHTVAHKQAPRATRFR